MGYDDAAKPHYLGHRERLRKRFREGGPDALPDYELLELVLFRAMPRRDTKPLAKAILARFGTFAEAMNAPYDLLLEVPGLGDAAVTEIKLVRAAALRLMRGEVLERPLLGSWKQVLDYCCAAIGHRDRARTQSPVRRSHAVPRRYRDDQADRRCGKALGRCGPRPHHRGQARPRQLSRARPDLVGFSEKPCLTLAGGRRRARR